MELFALIQTVCLIIIAFYFEKFVKLFTYKHYAKWEKEFLDKFDVREKDPKAIGDED